MRAKLIEAVRSLWRKKTTVTLELDGFVDADKWRDKDLKVDIDIYRKKRSLSANAYFHVLADKLADKNSVSKACQKNELITKYGQKLFIDNKPAVIKTNIPHKDVLELEEPHLKFIRYSENAAFYYVYRGSHTYDTYEMSKLIEGTVLDAQEAGIETMTPDEIAKLTAVWQPKGGYF